MKNITKRVFLLVFSMLLTMFVSCEKGNNTENDKADYGTVSVSVKNISKATSFDNTITGLTATCVRALGDNYVAVSFHGRKGEESGLVQIIKYNEDNTYNVVSELNTLNARVNVIETDKNKTIFIGFDARQDYSGVSAIELQNDYTFSQNLKELKPLPISGISINGLTYSTKHNKLWAATGRYMNNTFEMAAGICKLDYQNSVLKIMHKGLNSQYVRGRWVDYNDGDALILYFASPDKFGSTAWRKPVLRYFDNIEQYINGYDWAFKENPLISTVLDETIMQNKNTCRIYKKENQTLLFACTDKLAVYNKIDNNATLANTINKGTHYVDFNENILYAAHSTDGVYKYQIEDDGSLTRMGKFVSNILTESNTNCSANFVIYNNGKIFVAYGYAGLVILSDSDIK